jgi:anti-sigma B factor antagonist
MDRDEIEFAVEVNGGTVVPRGELDIATQGELRAALVHESARGAVVLDLSRLRFIDTSGMRLILETAEAAKREGFEFTVLRGSPSVQRLFEIAGVMELVPFRDGEEGGPP